MDDTKKNPAWRDFSAHFVSDIAGVPSGTETISVGGMHCESCGKSHFVIVARKKTGACVLVALEPQEAVDLLKGGVEILGELGEELLALNALRATTLVNEIASMTETEADFMDGLHLREHCRQMLQGKMTTFPRLYDANDRLRAIVALTDKIRATPGGFFNLDFGQTVDAIAEALGMRSAA